MHYFIHLNLAISLFLAYLVFVFGIQLARENEVYETVDLVMNSLLLVAIYLLKGSMYICGSSTPVPIPVCLLLDDV